MIRRFLRVDPGGLRRREALRSGGSGKGEIGKDNKNKCLRLA